MCLCACVYACVHMLMCVTMWFIDSYPGEYVVPLRAMCAYVHVNTYVATSGHGCLRPAQDQRYYPGGALLVADGTSSISRVVGT